MSHSTKDFAKDPGALGKPQILRSTFSMYGSATPSNPIYLVSNHQQKRSRKVVEHRSIALKSAGFSWIFTTFSAIPFGVVGLDPGMVSHAGCQAKQPVAVGDKNIAKVEADVSG